MVQLFHYLQRPCCARNFIRCANSRLRYVQQVLLVVAPRCMYVYFLTGIEIPAEKKGTPSILSRTRETGLAATIGGADAPNELF